MSWGRQDTCLPSILPEEGDKKVKPAFLPCSDKLWQAEATAKIRQQQQTGNKSPSLYLPVKWNDQVSFTGESWQNHRNQSYWQTWQTPFSWQGKQSAGPRGVEWSRAEDWAEWEGGRERERASGRESKREREGEGAINARRLTAGRLRTSAAVLWTLQASSGYRQSAHTRLLPCWQDTKLPNQPRPPPPITTLPLNIINSNGATQ